MLVGSKKQPAETAKTHQVLLNDADGLEFSTLLNCALVYQVLWLRMLGLVFGVTAYAASTVWATFMAGLAIGSAAAGVLADRVRSPLKWFGAAEILVGATALATPAMLSMLQHVYIRLYPSLPQSLA